MNPEQNTEVADRKTPLWQTTLTSIREVGLAYGAKFDMPWLENALNAERNTLSFGSGISAINDEIIEEGYYLSSRDQSGLYYVVVTPERAEGVCDSFGYRATRCLRRQVTLLGGVLTNPTANLAEDQRRRLESKQEKSAFRLVMLRRSERIRQIVTKHAPKLLNP